MSAVRSCQQAHRVLKTLRISVVVLGCMVSLLGREILAMKDIQSAPLGEFEKNHEVTIIGAGPAGLLAAYRLKQSGVKVRVLEARGRSGGRLFSYPQSKIEFGAWSLGDEGNIELIEALTRELGLELNTSRMPFPGFFVHDGRMIDMAAHFAHVVEKARRVLEPIIDASRTMQEVLDLFFKDQPLLKDFCQSLALLYHGSPARELSAKIYKEALIELCLGGVSDVYTHEATFAPLYRVKGGNDLLVRRLAEFLEGSIELNKPLKGLYKGEEKKIKLHFADGTSQESDNVILALPVSAYQALDIEEGLIPSWQLEGIKKTRPGIVSKIFLPGRGTKHL